MSYAAKQIGAACCVAILKITEKAATKLLNSSNNYIVVGWVRCRVRRRITVLRCYKCLGFGHDKYACKGPERSSACFRFGKEGRRMRACKEIPLFFLFLERGFDHVAGSGACKTLRAALFRAKNKHKNN